MFSAQNYRIYQTQNSALAVNHFNTNLSFGNKLKLFGAKLARAWFSKLFAAKLARAWFSKLFAAKLVRAWFSKLFAAKMVRAWFSKFFAAKRIHFLRWSMHIAQRLLQRDWNLWQIYAYCSKSLWRSNQWTPVDKGKRIRCLPKIKLWENKHLLKGWKASFSHKSMQVCCIRNFATKRGYPSIRF